MKIIGNKSSLQILPEPQRLDIHVSRPGKKGLPVVNSLTPAKVMNDIVGPKISRPYTNILPKGFLGRPPPSRSLGFALKKASHSCSHFEKPCTLRSKIKVAKKSEMPPILLHQKIGI
jgi:hypothetical protein